MIDTRTKKTRAAFYNSGEWRSLREAVLQRDNYECKWCREEGRVVDHGLATMEVDHIKEVETHPELAMEPDNLRTLCKDCHNKRHERFNYRKKTEKTRKWEDDEWWG